MKIIQETLGQTLSAKAVAKYLSLDVKTVRKYYRELGGIRLGSRIVFFEKEFINAIQKRTELDRPSSEGWAEAGESISDQSRSSGLGSRHEAKVRERLEREDRHGLFG